MLNLFRIFKKTSRAWERVAVKVMFKYRYDNRDYMGLLKDISVNGFGFFSAQYLEPGKDIDIEVVVECKSQDIDLKWVILKETAKIKWVGINHSANLVDYDVGCEFTDVAGDNRESLAEILKQIRS